MAGIQATGVGSNLDVAGLVNQLMEVERQPLAALDKKEAAVQVKISAYGTFRGALTTFQGTLQSLADSSNYSVAKGSLDDASVASITTSSTAPAGSYSFEVTKLAKSQKLVSGVYASTTDTVGTGTLTIQFGKYDDTNGANSWTLNGSKATQSVNIDAAHSSLQGVRDAINAANIGVSANIVNDGTGFRLVVSSKDTGASNGLKIMVSGDGSGDTDMTGLSQLAYDPTLAAGSGENMTQIMAAEDAELYVDGLKVTKASNTITDVIAGTTINLLKTNTGSPTKLNIATDSNAVMTSVDSFVKAYNDLNKTISDLTKYNADAKTSSPLQGDAAIRTIASQIRDSLTSLVSGAVGSYKALPQVGIAFDRNGALTVDKAKLQAALKADPTAVQSLFASAGVVDDPLVSYAGGTSATKAGNYAVNLTQVATHGTVVGSAAVQSLTIDGTNDTLSVSVNGTSTTVKLTQATYASQAALMAEVQSQINGSQALLGKASISLTADGSNVLTMASTTWGKNSKVTVTGNGAENLFGAAPTTTAGVDVEGTIGSWLATGAGQRLTGSSGAVGLKLDVFGGATGSRGTVRFGVGIAGKLDQMITQLVGSKGLLASQTTSLQNQVKQIEDDRTTLNERLDATEQRYKTQFSSLDQQLTSMQSMSAYLAQQLAAISSIR
jgi:flagellar hook-associated protein 2